MRLSLRLITVYIVILLFLVSTLQFDLVDKGTIITNNFFFITGMHASNLKNALSDNDAAYEALQNDGPQHPLKEVLGKIDRRRILIPNSAQIFDGLRIRLTPTNVTINSAGMRDYEYSYKKPANVCRIAILGDSYTFGWGVELNETYAKVLERKLNLESKDNNQVLNFGVPGYGFAEETAHLQEYVLKFNPDAVIIASMADDLRNWTRQNEITNELMRTFDADHPDTYGKNLSEFAKMQILTPEINRIIGKEEIAQFYNSTKSKELMEKYFSTIYDISIVYNFTVIIITLSVSEKQIDAEENIAKKYNWTFVDSSEVFDKTKYEITKVRLKPPVDGHPTPYAHQLIADKLHNEMNWTELCRKVFNESRVVS